MTTNISNFYLNSPLLHPDYIKIKIRDNPEVIINEYELRDR
jgi:hypothetical protein